MEEVLSKKNVTTKYKWQRIKEELLAYDEDEDATEDNEENNEKEVDSDRVLIFTTEELLRQCKLWWSRPKSLQDK